MYGKNRFCEIIRRNANEIANDIVNAVYDDIDKFTSGLKSEDDITLVVIKIEGNSEKHSKILNRSF